MNERMKKGDFFIIGQAKSGTTALAEFLDQHPQIAMSRPKEPSYFATDLINESDRFHGKKKYFKVRSHKEYKEIYKHAGQDQIIGEASTSYIYSKVAARNIHKYNPDAKIVIILRNPVDFLHSLHRQYVNETVEHEQDFPKALHLEHKRKKGKHISSRVRVPSYLYYSDRVKYAEQISRYLKFFSKKQVLVIFHDDFVQDNAAVYRKILKFLSVKDQAFLPDFKTVHGSKKPRSKTMNALANSPALKNLVFAVVGRDTYHKLTKKVAPLMFKPAGRNKLKQDDIDSITKMVKKENQKLSKLLNTSLPSAWDA